MCNLFSVIGLAVLGGSKVNETVKENRERKAENRLKKLKTGTLKRRNFERKTETIK